jgi:pimeloyl-ACP methyl ester carboxylesterase
MMSPHTQTPNLRLYGEPPYRAAVIHGGPGAPGSMAPVARELAAEWGILEPLQTKASLEGQLDELKSTLNTYGDLPVVLIGWSWGAMLSFIFAARWPETVKKLILVGSGVYDESYAASIMETRLSRLDDAGKREFDTLTAALNDPAVTDKNTPLARLGRLFGTRTDAYHPLESDSEVLEVRYDIHQQVWHDAQKYRQSGDLLRLGHRIDCPVIAIHGDYDPHPPAGIQNPLARVVNDFRFVLLNNCGHTPWIEADARQAFYALLRRELE